jgi:hypothetical protein
MKSSQSHLFAILLDLLFVLVSMMLLPRVAAKTLLTASAAPLVDRNPGVSALAQPAAVAVNPLFGAGWAVQVDAGERHTCALTVDGGVKCWGGNSYGQLGDGTTTGRLTPVAVAGLRNGVQAIAAGAFHTCALTTSGEVKCWGQNDDGQLGDGTTQGRLAPVDVGGLGDGVRAIATGSYHTCAVTETGGVKCWGENGSGQLGDGTTQERLTPVDVVGLVSGIRAISAGSGHTCALPESGGAKCWGAAGDSWDVTRLTPVDIVGLTGHVRAISAGGGIPARSPKVGAPSVGDTIVTANWGMVRPRGA